MARNNKSRVKGWAANKWLFLFFGLSVALRVASAPTASASYLLIAGFALLGRTSYSGSRAVMAIQHAQPRLGPGCQRGVYRPLSRDLRCRHFGSVAWAAARGLLSKG
jgi:hypothetical protein